MKKLLVIAGCALAAILPTTASAAPQKPVGSENAVINQVCNHYEFYLNGFYDQAVFWLGQNNTAKYNEAVSYLVWTIVVHNTYCGDSD
jgi:hypothetical protein